MLTERNPYDPVEIKMPTFFQAVKVGAGFAFGAAVCLIVLWVPFFVLWLIAFGAWLSPAHR